MVVSPALFPRLEPQGAPKPSRSQGALRSSLNTQALRQGCAYRVPVTCRNQLRRLPNQPPPLLFDAVIIVCSSSRIKPESEAQSRNASKKMPTPLARAPRERPPYARYVREAGACKSLAICRKYDAESWHPSVVGAWSRALVPLHHVPGESLRMKEKPSGPSVTQHHACVSACSEDDWDECLSISAPASPSLAGSNPGKPLCRKRMHAIRQARNDGAPNKTVRCLIRACIASQSK